MISNIHSSIRELLGLDHATATMSRGNHPVREQFPELLGIKGISNTVKKNWQITDLLPLGVILLFFVLLVWFFGVYSPGQKLVETNKKIDILSRAFDARSNQVLNELNRLKASFTENELPESTLKWLSGLELQLSNLTLSKPSEAVIAKRFDAEKRFTELAAEIVESRDLSQYGELGYIFDGLEPSDSEIRKRGQKTISLAEKWLDELTPQEVKAKSLLSEFLGTPMPKRESQLRVLIFNEWKLKHTSLLELWKSLKEYEVEWAEFLEKKLAREKAQRDRQLAVDKRRSEIEVEMADNKKAIEQERVKVKAAKKKSSKKKTVKATSAKPKTRNKNSELERRKKAASKLLD